MSIDSFETKNKKILTVRQAAKGGAATVLNIQWDTASGIVQHSVSIRLKPEETKRLIRALVESI